MRLLLGAGVDPWPGWFTVDADEKYHPTWTATIPPLPVEVMNRRWEAIAAIHFIEHLHVWEARALLSACHRILQPGGILILEQPNIEYCMKVFLGLIEPPPGLPHQYDLWGLYGNPDDENPLYGHKWGYTPESLTWELHCAGFMDVQLIPAQFHHPARDFRLEAVR